MTDELDLNEDGNIKTFPLMRYSTYEVADMFAILRLGFATSEADFQRGILQHVQLTLTPLQLRSLAETLSQAEQSLLSKIPSSSGN